MTFDLQIGAYSHRCIHINVYAHVQIYTENLKSTLQHLIYQTPKPRGAYSKALAQIRAARGPVILKGKEDPNS